MNRYIRSGLHSIIAGLTLALSGLAGVPGLTGEAQAASIGSLIGEVESITVDFPTDKWSGGTMVVAGQIVTIPRNLLIDFPADRMTLQEMVHVWASTPCKAVGKSGLAKTDPATCNTYGTGANATIQANRTSGGNLIAGDVFMQKGIESFSGQVTYINYDQGYFRLGGTVGNPDNGVMVRLNDPDSRHTVQSGLGCAVGTALAGQLNNCSPDVRFNLDPDNYTNVYTTGYPMCIPSTVLRTFNEAALQLFNVAGATDAAPVTVPFDLNGDGSISTVPVRANADGTGDLLCSVANRTTNNGLPMVDSRFMAPIMLGDNVTADGNWEVINGVRFLSAHSTMVGKALTTKSDTTQPDYMFLDEVFIDGPAFQNQRVRSLFIGFVTLASPTADVNFWSLHYDPVDNIAHELPLASVRGCDLAGGAGNCTAQGLGGVAGANIFRIRYDLDFNTGAQPKLNPCAHLLADLRMPRVCNNNASPLNLSGMFGILSPMPHEIQARTGHKLQFGDALISLDIQGKEATNGQYLFPFGMGLGGIDIPNFFEIDLNGVASPTFFSGITWNLDRRVGPGGCDPACEGTPQPLDPFPYEGLDPRTQTNLPLGGWNDSVFTAAPLTDVRNRIFSFVTPTGLANGDATVLAWPPVNPAVFPIASTPGSGVGPINHPPTIVVDLGTAVSATVGVPFTYDVNATDPDGVADTLTYSLVAPFPGGMLINQASGLITGWTPTAAQAPTQVFSARATDLGGLFDTQAFSITVNAPPVIAPIAPGVVREGLAFSRQIVATDVNGGTLTYTLPIAPAGMTISGTGLITWPVAVVGINNVTVRVTDATLLFAERSFTVTVAANAAPVITSIAPPTGKVGVGYSYQVVATDANNDPITYSLVPPTQGNMVISTLGLISWTPTAAEVGSRTMAVQASDGSLSTIQSFTVLVASAQVAPVITSSAPPNGTVGVAYVYNVTATDANVGDVLTFSLVTPPAGVAQVAMAINPTTGQLTWTPGAGQTGLQSATVRVTDNGIPNLSADQTFQVTVAAAPNVAPVIISTPPANAPPNVQFIYDVNATDANAGDTITYSLVTTPTAAQSTVAMAINPTTGLVTWTPSGNGLPGNRRVTFSVRATDNGVPILSATQTVTVRVQ